jgi:amino acid permease
LGKMVFGIGKKKSGDYSSGSEKHSPSEEAQKAPFTTQQYGAEAGIGKDGLTDPNDAGHSLHRGLSARQITMIAIGGGLRSRHCMMKVV